jgi:DNA-binding transcriptional regulator GbsR (MarR family)
MKYTEAKEELIQAWGNLGSSWGVNRTMAQIHALLMISTRPLTTEEIMTDLNISRGNANMNLRALLDWGLAHRILVPGERKEYFKSEKDVWALARQVAKERKKRELDPLLTLLRSVSELPADGTPETKEFKKITKDLKNFAEKSEGVLDTFVKSEESWFWGAMIKLVK